MNKQVIQVPAGIRYISQWNGFSLPEFPHIMDKQIPGCGFTEWVLTNCHNTIICSPRIILMKNKEEQHEGSVFRVKGSRDLEIDIDKDLNKQKQKIFEAVGLSEEEEKSFTEKLTKDISSYFYKMRSERKPCKILVTYDSFRILRDVLISLSTSQDFYGIYDTFQIVIDEFQSIFTDSKFKSTTEMEFVKTLQWDEIYKRNKGLPERVCYLSATPMMEEYLSRLDDFKFLPYFELDWKTLDPSRIIKPNLTVRIISSITVPAKKIIESYKSGNFEKAYRKNSVTGKIDVIESKEAIIYVNSVNNIINIIKNTGLKPEEVNILCSGTDDNKKKIRARLGKGFSIGRVLTQKDLKEGQKQKMFTLCTRTVYLGADFYSDNARSFILSDANSDCLAVDISLDLPQILGRQRWECNPWKNSAEFYCRPLLDDNKKKMTKEKFDQVIARKIKETQDLLKAYAYAPDDTKGSVRKNYLYIAKSANYKENYVAVDIRTPEAGGPAPVQNNLVLIAEQRAFDIQQIDYVDRFSVFHTIDSVLKTGNQNIDKEVDRFFDIYDNISNVRDKLKFICEPSFELSDTARQRIESSIDDKIKNYLSLGKDRCKALGYNTSKILKELGVVVYDPEKLKAEIYSIFKVGERISKECIKSKLKDLYDFMGYKKIPKANDLEQWFEIKNITINEKQPEGKLKRTNGFEIIKKKG